MANNQPTREGDEARAREVLAQHYDREGWHDLAELARCGEDMGAVAAMLTFAAQPRAEAGEGACSTCERGPNHYFHAPFGDEHHEYAPSPTPPTPEPEPDVIRKMARAMCDHVNGQGDFDENVEQRASGWEAQARCAYAELTHTTAPEPDAVPPGWKLVPVIATTAMTVAGDNWCYAAEMWPAMLAAAPAAPSPTPPTPEPDATPDAGENLGPLWRHVQRVQTQSMREGWDVPTYQARMAAALCIGTSEPDAIAKVRAETIEDALLRILAIKPWRNPEAEALFEVVCGIAEPALAAIRATAPAATGDRA